MKRLKQFDALVIEDFATEEYHLPKHDHNYYELIYIYKGCGTHHLNNIVFQYKAGDLFLIAPEDQHYFKVKKCTRFIFIKFTDHYFQSFRHLSANDFLLNRPEDMMRHKLLKEQKLCFTSGCMRILKNIIDNLLEYNCSPDIASSPMIYYHILCIFGMVRETLSDMDDTTESSQPDQELLLTYIHQYIYEPGKVQVKTIAAHFNIAPNYFSAWFRRGFGMSYRDYLNSYRSQLIERRIASGELTLKQIADEFGFTDESHLSRFFRNRFNIAPGKYKAQQNARQLV